MAEQVSKHQSLMDQAYNRWQANADWSKEDFINRLGPVEYEAVIVGNLNYQVENGGFTQWFFNDYYTPATHSSLQRIFTRMDTTASKLALSILDEAVRLYGDTDLSTISEWEWEGTQKALSALDDRYYAIKAELLAEFEAQLP